MAPLGNSNSLPGTIKAGSLRKAVIFPSIAHHRHSAAAAGPLQALIAPHKIIPLVHHLQQSLAAVMMYPWRGTVETFDGP